MPQSLQQELKQSKPFASAEVEAYLSLVRTYVVLSQPVNQLFKEFGITETIYNVLRIVRGGPPEGTPCSSVAERLLTRVPDVTRLVDRAVSMKLIRRNRPDTDRRLVLLTLTPKGARLLDAMEAPLIALQNKLMGCLSHEELTSLIETTAKLREAQRNP